MISPVRRMSGRVLRRPAPAFSHPVPAPVGRNLAPARWSGFLGIGLAALAGLLVAAELPLLALALVVGAAFAIAVLSSPERVALVLVCLTPFMVYPASVGSFSIFLAVPLFGFTSLVLLLRQRGASAEVARALPAKMFALLLAIAIGTSAASAEPTVALSRTAYLLLFGFFAWALATALVSRRISRDTLVRVVVVSGALAAFAVILQFVAQFGSGRSTVIEWMRDVLPLFAGERAGSRNWVLQDPEVLRGIFPFMTPPSAGQYLMLTLVAGVWLRRERRAGSGAGASLETVLVLTIAVALLLTFSRQSWIGALAGVAALSMVRRPLWMLAVIVALVLASITPIPGGDNTFGQYLVSASDTTTQSSSGRIAFWEEAIELIPSHALVGAGPGLFGTLTGGDLGVSYAHNVFLDAAVELGLAGALALIGVVVIALRSAHRRGQTVALAMLVAFVAASMFDDVLFFPRNGLLLAVVFALIVAPTRAPRPRDRAPLGPDRMSPTAEAT